MSDKQEVRTQFAALCYRLVRGKPQVLLVTSRGTKRWILPKGWPIKGASPAEAARQEAWEEAGVVGRAGETCLGLYSYLKMLDDGAWVPCVAMVHPVRVKSLSSRFPEKGERKRKWLTPKKAAARVAEPELARLLQRFDPSTLR